MPALHITWVEARSGWGLGWDWGCRWSGLSLPHFSLSPFCPLFLCAPTLLQAPEPRRKQSPRLASPQWPRPGWHSSRIAVGPPNAISCSPHVGCPRGHGDSPSHPLVFIAPISPGPKSSQRRKGLKASQWLPTGLWAQWVGPAPCTECSNRESLTVAWPSPEHAEPRSLSHCLFKPPGKVLPQKSVSPLLSSCI